MDWLDWVVRGAGGIFALLTLAFGFSRVSSFAERDVSGLWWVLFGALGIIWGIAQIADWTLPVTTTIYLANGGNESRSAQLGARSICVPALSYDGFSWRIDAPDVVTVTASGSEPEHRYPIAKGTWFINLSPIIVTADMYESSGSIDFDALFSDHQGVIHVSSRLGRPFRMFSQSPLDRIYSPSGDIAQSSVAGPCPGGVTEAAKRR